MTRRPGSLSKIRTLARKLAKDEDAQRQARKLAREGRGGDNEIAHVTPGEIVVPRELQTPDVMAALGWAAAGMGLSLDRLRVGARADSINPKTGAPEFRVDDAYKYWQDQPPTPMPEIVVRGRGGFPGTISRGSGGGTAGVASGRGEASGGGATSLLPPVPMEEITVTGKRIPWVPAERDLFARILFAEGASAHDIPGVMEALGSTINNRVGAPTFPKTLTEVILKEPGYDGKTNKLWGLAADPSKLTGPNASAYNRAFDVATSILQGKIPDPTGGAQFFYSGPTPRGFFRDGFSSGRLTPIQGNYGPFTIVKDGAF